MPTCFSIPVLIIVVFAILFSLLYSASIYEVKPEILTKPKLTGLQALEIVVSDLKAKVGDNYQDMGIYDTSEGFLRFGDIQLISNGQKLNASISENFDKRGIKLDEPLRFRLFYVHPNGTQFYIDSHDNAIANKCNILEGNCVPSKIYTDYAIGRLVYAFDVVWFAKDGSKPFEFYMIDADTGEIAFSFISKKPDSGSSLD